MASREQRIAGGGGELEAALARSPGRHTRVASRYAAEGAAPAAAGVTIDDVATVAVDGKGAGRAMDRGVTDRVGAHLGADFGAVRVHDDPLARQATAAMGARAFAHGGDVFLGPGESDRDLGLMAHELTHVAQQGAAATRAPQRQVTVGAASSPAEQQADQVAAQVTAGGRPAQLLIDDGAVQAGQMLKAQFLSQLRGAVTEAANEELGPAGWAVGCPYIERYFGRYAVQPAAAGEALLHRFAPGTSSCATAAAMIPIVVERVRAGVRQWKDTGAPPAGLPDEAAGDAAAAPPPAATMGTGQPLDGAAASRIGEAMGTSLADVRVHTGEEAHRFATAEGAIAVTAGNDIAFASGAYQPGTPAGDALLAHELAHVVQQRGAAPTVARAPRDGGGAAHEADADHAATGVMARLWGGVKAAARSVAPALRADYGLQRCPGNDAKRVPSVAVDADEAKRKAAVEALVKADKLEDATYYICNAYGYKADNMKVKIVDSMDDAWAVTDGDNKEGAEQVVRIGRDLFTRDYANIVRTIGHEFQHVLLSSQKDPITSVPEQEFIAHSWKVLDTSAPALSPDDQKAAMKKALSYWPKMPPARQTANAARKKQVDDWITAHP